MRLTTILAIGLAVGCTPPTSITSDRPAFDDTDTGQEPTDACTRGPQIVRVDPLGPCILDSNGRLTCWWDSEDCDNFLTPEGRYRWLWVGGDCKQLYTIDLETGHLHEYGDWGGVPRTVMPGSFSEYIGGIGLLASGGLQHVAGSYIASPTTAKLSGLDSGAAWEGHKAWRLNRDVEWVLHNEDGAYSNMTFGSDFTCGIRADSGEIECRGEAAQGGPIPAFTNGPYMHIESLLLNGICAASASGLIECTHLNIETGDFTVRTVANDGPYSSFYVHPWSSTNRTFARGCGVRQSDGMLSCFNIPKRNALEAFPACP